jgi:hypothetical protein
MSRVLLLAAMENARAGNVAVKQGPLRAINRGSRRSFTVSPDHTPPFEITRVRSLTATFQAGVVITRGN